MKRNILFVLILALILDFQSFAKSRPVASIPFERIGSYVVVRIKINNSTPLNFVLDTGVRNTIISELMPGDSVSLNYSNDAVVLGLGQGDTIKGYISKNNTLQAGRLKLLNKTVYVLEGNEFSLTSQTGYKINGLLGMDFLQDYVVEINYTDKRVRFFEQEKFEEPKNYEKMPVTVVGKKMYLQLAVLETDSAHQNIKMLIDTGAELNAWFQTLTNKAVQIPEKSIRGFIGQGLNGDIVGIYARVQQICIGSYCLKNPVVTFPDSATISGIVTNSDRDGTIGSQILSRFNYFIDTKNKFIYFKPNGTFTNLFKYNIAGIEISQIIPFVPQTEVIKVWENSPAAQAGIQVGDQIMEINGTKTYQLTISEIKDFFMRPSKRPMSMFIKRNGEEFPVKIDMKSKI